MNPAVHLVQRRVSRLSVISCLNLSWGLREFIEQLVQLIGDGFGEYIFTQASGVPQGLI